MIATLEPLFSDLNQTRKGGRKLQILDVRDPGEFRGDYRRAISAGHIPGAINIEWKSALRKDGRLKSPEHLRRIYSRLDNEAEVVTYCQSGYRAAHSWLVLRLLGFRKVKNYMGSWYEWGNSRDAPVEKDAG